MQNGELYNHDEIRRELVLGRAPFPSRCDTEIIPHLYEAYGERFPERLRGKFGIAVWDGARRRAVARPRPARRSSRSTTRDAGDSLVFASELKSVLASGLVAIELDFEAIDAYLTLGFFPGPRTPLAACEARCRASILVVEHGSGARARRTGSYPRPAPETRRVALDDYADELLELLGRVGAAAPDERRAARRDALAAASTRASIVALMART